MNTPSEMELLSSQRQFVQRLQHAASFESQLILASGLPGSGKTTLAHKFLTESETTLRQALCRGSERLSAAALRHQILTQLVPEPLFDEGDPLHESLLRMLPEQATELLVVVDDAHLIPVEAWQELSDTVVMLREQATQHRLVVVLFAISDLVPPGIVVEWTGQAWFIDMNIPKLGQEEQILLLDRLIGDVPAVWNEEAIISRLESLPPTLSALINFATEITQGATPEKAAFPWHRITLPAALILALVCIYLGYQILTDPELLQDLAETQRVEETEQSQTLDLEQGADLNAAVQAGSQADNLDDPDPTLPRVISVDPVVTETPALEGKVVVLPDELLAKMDSLADQQQQASGEVTAGSGSTMPADEDVARLMQAMTSDDDKSSSHQQDVDEVSDDSASALAEPAPELEPEPAPELKPEPAPEAAPPPEPQPASASEPAPGSDAPADPSASAPAAQETLAQTAAAVTEPKLPQQGQHPLLEVEDSAFTIQLAVMQTRQGIDAVLKRAELAGREDIYHYQLLRNGKRLHVAIMGIYATKPAARDAISKLPEAAAAMGVWPKSFAVIKTEVRTGLELGQ